MVLPTGAHPRAGGENRRGLDASLRAGGSSPRGRGKQPPSWWRRVPGGLIPARAGKTSARIRWMTWTRAHPRAGGENGVLVDSHLCSRGSSPRGRGKPRPGASLTGPTGLIPARAGKTFISFPCHLGARAHPRAGGENMVGNLSVWCLTGSSPRGRGKPVARALGDLCPRLIPARAGKTFISFPHHLGVRAHPRAGGENGKLLSRKHPLKGSSPRGRGKRVRGSWR